MRIAICDDDKSQRDLIEQYVIAHSAEYQNIKTTTFSSGEDLLAALKQKTFDILLLDIELHGISGIETATKIRESNSDLIIIFITGYVNYVSDALKTNAFQFLVKPVKKDFFDEEFKRAISKYQNEHQKYVIRLKSGVTMLEVNDIIYIESSNREMYIYTKDRKHTKPGKIGDEEDVLTNYGFVRCHQGFLVNMKYILDIEKNNLILKNGIKIMLSKRKRLEVLERYNMYFARCSV